VGVLDVDAETQLLKNSGVSRILEAKVRGAGGLVWFSELTATPATLLPYRMDSLHLNY